MIKQLVFAVATSFILANSYANFNIQVQGTDVSYTANYVLGLYPNTVEGSRDHNSNSPIFYPIKMPGLATASSVTLEGIIASNSDVFWGFYQTVALNTVARATYIITDNSNGLRFILSNAWPTKINGTDLKKQGSEVYVSSIDIAFESVKIAEPAENYKGPE